MPPRRKTTGTRGRYSFPAGWKGSERGGSCRSASASCTPRSGGCWDGPRNGSTRTWGVPISAAHLGYAIACFAAHRQTLRGSLPAAVVPDRSAHSEVEVLVPQGRPPEFLDPSGGVGRRRRRPVVPAARPPPGRKVRQVVSAGPRGQRPVGSDHYGQDSHRIAPEKAVARSR